MQRRKIKNRRDAESCLTAAAVNADASLLPRKMRQ